MASPLNCSASSPRRQAAIIFAALVTPAIVNSQVIFSTGFESGVLDPQLSVSTVGTFNSGPGIKSLTSFGSTRGFGFGLSGCSASCFSSFATTLTINFGVPTFIGSISFKEMELFDNWGSNGAIYLDNVPLFTGSGDFGRLPYNDRQPDSSFRTRDYQVGRIATTIQLQVYDITRLSEIYLDDIVVTAVPEPSTAALLFLGAVAAVWRANSNKRKLRAYHADA